METTRITVRILPNNSSTPPGKLADAEVHFAGGELDGLKLIGFAVWLRRDGNGRNVTSPRAPRSPSTAAAAASRCCAR
ncbi:MAG: hypothetical protein R2752_20085 [Vicinamibacterales bacterium]